MLSSTINRKLLYPTPLRILILRWLALNAWIILLILYGVLCIVRFAIQMVLHGIGAFASGETYLAVFSIDIVGLLAQSYRRWTILIIIGCGSAVAGLYLLRRIALANKALEHIIPATDQLISALKSVKAQSQTIMYQWDRGRQQRDLPGLAKHTSITLPDLTCAMLAPNGKSVACGSFRGTIIIYDADSGKAQQHLAGLTSNVNMLAWSHQGNYLAGSSGKQLIIWDLTTGTHKNLAMSHMSTITDLAWSPSEDSLASSSEDTTIIIWDGSVGIPRQVLVGHTNRINCIAWSPDGAFLASGDDRNVIHIWNWKQGTLIQSLIGHSHKVLSLAWSANGKRIASGAHDHSARIWDSDTGKIILIVDDFTAPVVRVAFIDDNVFAGVEYGKEIQIHFHAIGSNQRIAHITTVNSHVILGAILNELLDNTITQLHQIYSNFNFRLTTTFIRNHDRVFTRDLALGLGIDLDFVHDLARNRDRDFAQTLALDFARSLNHALALDFARELHSDHLYDKKLDLTQGSTSNTNYPLAYDLNRTLNRALDLVSDLAFELAIAHTQIHARAHALVHAIAICRALVQAQTRARAYAFAHAHTLNYSLNSSTLLISSDAPGEIALYQIDLDTFLASVTASIEYYVNAKVVLLGDTGVGKTALGRALRGLPYGPTDSTHGRFIWTLLEEKKVIARHITQNRELLLWDMAGQEGYRVIHQLYLDEVTVALVVFNSKDESDPFAGVYYWTRALRKMQQREGGDRIQTRFLVIGRADRGGIGVPDHRIYQVLSELRLDSPYFITSALSGQGIDTLRQAITTAIQWDRLPAVIADDLFIAIRRFILDQKEGGQRLQTTLALFERFSDRHAEYGKTVATRARLETVIDRLSTAGIVTRLRWGGFILLQPELLDSYLSALIQYVRDEPDGLGIIGKNEAETGGWIHDGNFPRAEYDDEQIMLSAMVSDLLAHEIALMQGSDLVFPAQTTRSYDQQASYDQPTIAPVTYTIEGAIDHIYSTLAVRLHRSSIFPKQGIWKDVVTFEALAGGICGIRRTNLGEGRADLSLFYAGDISPETRSTFEAFIAQHLQERRVVIIARTPHFFCPNCNVQIQDIIVQRLYTMGQQTVSCQICHTTVMLHDTAEQLREYRRMVVNMNMAANDRRDREVKHATADTRRQHGDFDAFFCYNNKDSNTIKRIGDQLADHGISTFIYERDQRPGIIWVDALQEHISKGKPAIVFIGPHGLGGWQPIEIDALTVIANEHQEASLIPTFLPGAEKLPNRLIFLKLRHAVDFRKPEPDPIMQLVWGIMGKHGQ
jgi:Ras of Complex, Roc, domain of DAPkinase/TIR domain/WD domain, G-beta repeat